MEMNIDICIISKGAEMYKICVIRKILNMWSGMKIDKGNGCWQRIIGNLKRKKCIEVRISKVSKVSKILIAIFIN